MYLDRDNLFINRFGVVVAVVVVVVVAVAVAVMAVVVVVAIRLFAVSVLQKLYNILTENHDK